MKFKIALILVLALASAASAQYQIDWYVIGAGGGTSSSANYQLSGTIGQPIVGSSSSASYQLDAGFWVGAAQGGGGCPYLLGDINGNTQTNGIDVVYGVNYFKGGSVPPVRCDMCPEPSPFYAAGDVNGNCQFNGIDISYFVNYLKGGAALRPCTDCLPASLAAPPVMPAIMPIAAPLLNSTPEKNSVD